MELSKILKNTSKTIGAATLAIGAMAGNVSAAEYPTKTVEVITHAGNGGGTDVTTRMMMLRARRELKADMVVVNKKGGGGAVAMNHYLTVPPRWPFNLDVHNWPRGNPCKRQNKDVARRHSPDCARNG